MILSIDNINLYKKNLIIDGSQFMFNKKFDVNVY